MCAHSDGASSRRLLRFKGPTRESFGKFSPRSARLGPDRGVLRRRHHVPVLDRLGVACGLGAAEKHH